jgi:hypothetical protein
MRLACVDCKYWLGCDLATEDIDCPRWAGFSLGEEEETRLMILHRQGE